MKKLAYERPDGGISVVIPVPKSDIEKILGPLSDAEYESHVRANSLPSDALNVAEVDDESLPPSREFRDAWSLSGNAVAEDLQKSIDIKLKRIRAERNDRLAVTDGEYTRALEAEDSVKIAELKVTRQKLRDATLPLKDGSIRNVDELRGKTLDDYLV